MNTTIGNPDQQHRRDEKGKTETKDKGKSKARLRMTAQLSESLLEAVEQRANLEVLPSAIFIRRAIGRFLRDVEPSAPPLNVSQFGEGKRSGERGPLRQWPRGVSYVVDEDVAEELEAMAAKRSESRETKTSVAELVREAIVFELESPAFPQRQPLRDEHGFTTSGAGHRGRAMQRRMDDAWSATNE